MTLSPPASTPSVARGQQSALHPSSFYQAEADYLLHNPVGDYTTLRSTPLYVTDTHTYYRTVYDPSFMDQAGTQLAKLGYSLAVGAAERIDPGLSPGLEANKYAFNANLDQQLALLGSRNVPYTVTDNHYVGSTTQVDVLPGYVPALSPYNS